MYTCQLANQVAIAANKYVAVHVLTEQTRYSGTTYAMPYLVGFLSTILESQIN